jgi:hypothetical protein
MSFSSCTSQAPACARHRISAVSSAGLLRDSFRNTLSSYFLDPLRCHCPLRAPPGTLSRRLRSSLRRHHPLHSSLSLLSSAIALLLKRCARFLAPSSLLWLPCVIERHVRYCDQLCVPLQYPAQLHTLFGRSASQALSSPHSVILREHQFRSSTNRLCSLRNRTFHPVAVCMRCVSCRRARFSDQSRGSDVDDELRTN